MEGVIPFRVVSTSGNSGICGVKSWLIVVYKKYSALSSFLKVIIVYIENPQVSKRPSILRKYQ
jgi:hypothetical protein